MAQSSLATSPSIHDEAPLELAKSCAPWIADADTPSGALVNKATGSDDGQIPLDTTGVPVVHCLVSTEGQISLDTIGAPVNKVVHGLLKHRRHLDVPMSLAEQDMVGSPHLKPGPYPK